MNDQAIEQEIQAKGKTAPRITPADIEANIVEEHYFTARQGAYCAAWQGTAGETTINDVVYKSSPSLDLLTFCVLVLRNGFTVTGESACASPENFDAEIGSKVARQNAVDKVWPLMGYALKQQLHQAANQPPAPGAAHAGYSTLAPHQQRVVDEAATLDSNRAKLRAFIDTNTFARLDENEQNRLRRQLLAMAGYSDILAERIAAF